MQTPFFSVVIPAYNAAHSLHETLDSVRQQSWRDFEVLVVDDGSTDETADIVRAFAAEDPRFRLLPCPRRFGLPAGPRNLGVKAAGGEYIAFLDADDLWKPEKLANDAAFLERDPVDLLYSGCDYFVDRPDNIVVELDPPDMGRSFFIRNLVMIQTVCVKRHLFSAQGLVFDEDPRLRGIEDYHFLLEIHCRGLRMARRPGSDVLYRKSSPTSIYPRGNLPLLLYRHARNLRRIRDKYRVPLASYGSYMALTLFYKTVQFLLRRA